MTKHVSLFHRPQPVRPASRSTSLFCGRTDNEVPECDTLRSPNSAVVAAALTAAHARMQDLVGAS